MNSALRMTIVLKPMEKVLAAAGQPHVDIHVGLMTNVNPSAVLAISYVNQSCPMVLGVALAMTVNQGDATFGSHAYQKQKMANLVQMILIVLVIIVVIRGGEMCVRLRVKEEGINVV